VKTASSTRTMLGGCKRRGAGRVAMSIATRGPATAYRSWLPRLSGRLMRDLRVWMIGFGLLIGVAFPFVIVALGVPSDIALRAVVFVATLLAGLVVAVINHALAQAVVGVRLRPLAAGMQRVDFSLVGAAYTGDWAACDPQSCQVPVDSADGVGDVAASLNKLVEGLATSHRVADASANLRHKVQVLQAHHRSRGTADLRASGRPTGVMSRTAGSRW
jgi:hypothetical protein